MSVYVDVDAINDTLKKEKNFSPISSRINKEGEPPTATMEAEKRIRREIANSNERRRMQSINNGFQSLRSLLPHHEGEKLSKAAILQQTAEYIYSLEQEKTRLLSQNCQLKRLVNQHESGGGGGGGELPPKKRKTEIIVPTTTTESSDEGLGSMSPEPVAIIGVTMTEPSELRRQLEKERHLRRVLEEQVRQFENQLFQQQQQKTTQIYQIEETDDDIQALQLVTADNLPPIGHTQTVVCSPQNSRSPSPEPQQQQQENVQQLQRLPSVLEAAIKAEPKVEVERLPSPSSTLVDEGSVVAITVTAAAAAATTTTTTTTSTTNSSSSTTTTQPSRIYVSNTSRQNLETIVEAIRHLEGDHLFGDEPQQQVKTQDVPLALTTTTRNATIKTEMNTFLDFRTTQQGSIQQQQQSRPGVIVVKQAS